ncbi:MAG TPA: small multi-drug export protein [Planctomycetota bacterium]|nr:small multi-drug export protein [Planctomycetota bacterium]
MHEPPPRPELDRFRWWAAGVAGLVLASLAAYRALEGPDVWLELTGLSVTVFLSKLAIFQGAIEGHAWSPWTLAVIAWEIDLVVSTLILLWIGRLELLPVAGPALRRAHAQAHEALRRYPGLRRMAVGGITFFVFLPLPGSGAVTGTLIGQIVGLARPTSFLTVAVGAGLACTAYAAAAVYLGEQWRELLASPWTLVLSALGLALFVAIAWRYVKGVLSTA